MLVSCDILPQMAQGEIASRWPSKEQVTDRIFPEAEEVVDVMKNRLEHLTVDDQEQGNYYVTLCLGGRQCRIEGIETYPALGVESGVDGAVHAEVELHGLLL